MKRSTILAGGLLSALALTFTTSACAGTANDNASGSGGSKGGEFSVGLELTGARNDNGYDEAIYNGLAEAKDKRGINIQVAENKTSLADQTAAVSTLAQSNDVVIVVSFIGDAAKSIAQQYPNTHFFVVDGQLDPAIPNLHAFSINQGQAAYVAGRVAGGISKSGTVGYVGASEIPSTTGSFEGFNLGVTESNPTLKVLKTYTGSFVDSSAAKEATAAQISQGADVIYTFLDSATDGAIAAVQASGRDDVKIFNITTLRCDAGPFVAGADVVTPTQFIASLIGDAIDKKYPTTKPVVGLNNPSDQRLTMCPGYESLQSVADKATQDVVDGTVKLPASVV